MADFPTAISITEHHEGGFCDDYDTGEIVNHGITAAFLAGNRLLPVPGDYKAVPIIDQNKAFAGYRMIPSGKIIAAFTNGVFDPAATRAARDEALKGVIDFIQSITTEQSIAWLKEFFWMPLHCDEIEDQTLAAKVFDVAVNAGEVTVAKLLQTAVNRLEASLTPAGPGIDVDGKIGPITIAVVNELNPEHLLCTFRLVAEERYRSIGGPKLPGWLARLES